MQKSLSKLINGYQQFRQIYTSGETHLMQKLAERGQSPEIMIVACCDSRVDPAILFQSEPGDLFVIRNVANIVPPYEPDGAHHGTSAALEFGICYLNVKHLIILGHSQCGGINALVDKKLLNQDDFISKWVDIADVCDSTSVDHCAMSSIINSYKNCLAFPWIKERLDNNTLMIHQWFFDIKDGTIQVYNQKMAQFLPLEVS